MKLLLAAVLLMQDKTAEEAFKKIEEPIEKAKTIIVLFTGEMTPPKDSADMRCNIDGYMLLAARNRVRTGMDLLFTVPGKKSSQLLVSDGSQMHVRLGQEKEFERDTPAEARSMFNRALTRSGLVVGASFYTEKAGGIELKDFLAISNLKHGDDDGKQKTLTYTVSLAKNDDAADVKLWYNPADWKPTKRTVSATAKAATKMLITENYDTITLNADIPDEKFKLPEEKK